MKKSTNGATESAIASKRTATNQQSLAVSGEDAGLLAITLENIRSDDPATEQNKH